MFREYNSIENSYRSREVQAIIDSGADQVEWIATEKLHGANFSIWVLPDEIKIGKRTAFTDGGFYGCQEVVEEIKSKLTLGIANFVIYGELYGAGIQSGINYGKKKFAAFDIFDLNLNTYLSYDQFKSLCETVGIRTCPEIARGKFSDLLDISPTFVTMASDVETKDTAEGFVMKPVAPLFLPNGSRVILKKKDPKFSEKSHGKIEKPKVELTKSQLNLIEVSSQYICENRIHSAVSKLGQEPQFNEVLQLVLEDVKTETLKDLEFDDVLWGSVKTQVCAKISPLIRKILYEN